MGNFGDVLHSQSLGIVLKKLKLNNKSKQHTKKLVQAKPEMLNLNKHTKTKPKPNLHSPFRTALMYVRIIVYNCHTQHSTGNSADNFPYSPPDNHHSSGDVYWTGGWQTVREK